MPAHGTAALAGLNKPCGKTARFRVYPPYAAYGHETKGNGKCCSGKPEVFFLFRTEVPNISCVHLSRFLLGKPHHLSKQWIHVRTCSGIKMNGAVRRLSSMHAMNSRFLISKRVIVENICSWVPPCHACCFGSYDLKSRVQGFFSYRKEEGLKQ